MTKKDKNLLKLSIICASLLLLRILFSGRITYIFLIWNLFLAGIPYLISRLIELKKDKLTKVKLLFFTFIWLVFFPNSPYIITDFIHLGNHHDSSFWIDLMLLTVFSITGIMYGISSLLILKEIYEDKFNNLIGFIFTYGAIFLSGFGIYIGRVLRWNTWDIIHHPIDVISDLSHIFFHPIVNQKIWIVSLSFSITVYVFYFLISSFTNVKPLNN